MSSNDERGPIGYAWHKTNLAGRVRSPLSTGLGVALGFVCLYLWGSDKALLDQAIVVGAAGVAGLVVPALLSFAWHLLTGPHERLSADVQQIATAVEEIRSATLARRPSGDSERVALFAIRSELDACDIRISEALSRKSWWNPDIDPLPADMWREHFDLLADPKFSRIRPEVEFAYQRCDRLNHRIRRYLNEHKQANLMPLVSPNVYGFRVEDENHLKGAHNAIVEARTVVSLYLGMDP